MCSIVLYLRLVELAIQRVLGSSALNYTECSLSPTLFALPMHPMLAHRVDGVICMCWFEIFCSCFCRFDKKWSRGDKIQKQSSSLSFSLSSSSLQLDRLHLTNRETHTSFVFQNTQMRGTVNGTKKYGSAHSY